MIIAAEEVQRSVLGTLDKLSQKNSLAHAYLFAGAPGIGKSEVALAAAKWFNCEDASARQKLEPCGICASCIKITSKHHPDIYVVHDEGTGTIKIDQIRDILSQFHLRPFMAQKKFFIIKDVEKLTVDAANTLLKTLEEPSPSNLIILTTSHIDKVLPTVRSRCHTMYISSLSQERIAQDILKEGNIISTQAGFVAYLSEGSLGKAKQLLEGDVVTFRNKIIDQFIFSKNSDELIKQVLGNKDKTGLFLKILLAWVRDAVLLKAGVADERICNQDKIRDLQDFVHKRSFASLDGLYRQVVETYKLFTENFNIKTSVLIIGEMIWEKS